MSEDKETKPTNKSSNNSKPAPPPPPMPPSSELSPPPPPSSSAATSAASGGKTNVLAIISLVLSLPMSFVALILGIIALIQIKKTGESGKGLAIAGIIVSSVSMLMGILFIVFFFVLAASSDNLNESIKESVEESVQVEGKVSDPVAIDTFTTAGDLKIKVNSVEEFEGEEYLAPAAGNIYLIVEVEVENDGFDTKYVSTYSQAYIKDADNNKYSVDILALPDGAATVDGELPSKEGVKGVIGFEVPQDATGLKLYFEDGSYTDVNIAVIDLGR